MNKEKYLKPMIDMLELNDDIILASGCIDFGCGDIIICLGDDCLTDVCTVFCETDNGSCGDHCSTYSH